MRSWKGKTRGGLLGHQIFVFVLQKLGITVAYGLLRFVAAYFIVFAPTATRSSYQLFRNIFSYSRLKSCWSVYENFYVFGQTLLDKVAIMAGIADFSYTFDGKQHIEALQHRKQGALLLSAHLGSWEIAGFFLREFKQKINVVMFEAEHEKIKEYLGNVMKERKMHIIPIKQDLSHIFLINQALKNNEIVCMHGDRFVANTRITSMNFMGKKAFFPLGPFAIATKFKIPYCFVYAVKSGTKSYHLSSTPIQEPQTNSQDILKDYVALLEKKLIQYPTQWFNYYDFWNESLQGGIYENKDHAAKTH